MFNFAKMEFTSVNEESAYQGSCVECDYPGDDGCNCNTATEED